MLNSAMVQNTEIKSGSGAFLQVVTFVLSGGLYAFDIEKVREIITLQAVEAVPDAPPFLEGVYSLRGEVVPVIDLRVRLGFGKIENTAEERKAVVTDHAGLRCAFLVDDIAQVRRLDDVRIQAPPPSLLKIGEKYLTGVFQDPADKTYTVLLDLDGLLSFELKGALGAK